MPNVRRLARRIGEAKVITDLAQRVLYRYDAITSGEIPLVVVLAEDREDVVETMRFAHAEGLPVFVRGGASGLSGGAVPTAEGVVLATNRMTRLSIDPDRRLAVAGPGVVTAAVSEAARRYGLYLPPGPRELPDEHQLGVTWTETPGAPVLQKGRHRRLRSGSRSGERDRGGPPAGKGEP